MNNKFFNYKLMVTIGFLLCLHTSSFVLALDESRLWLPKKYHELMPKLVDAARQAEKTSRCQWVIHGEMKVHKNTQHNYYFLITCRDESQHSYSLSYLYPVEGTEAALVAEQGGRNIPRKKKKPDKTLDSIDDETPALDSLAALDICHDALSTKTDAMDNVVIIEELVSAATQNKGGFFYKIPFNVDSALGNDVLYGASCHVDADGSAKVDIFLESAGALSLCKDSLKEETLLMRHVRVTDAPIKQIKMAEGGFFYIIEFNTKSRRGSPIQYTAECTVEADGSNELSIVLDKSGALAICKDTLRSEAIELKELEVIDQKIPDVIENEEGFFYQLPFDATLTGGSRGRYQAQCQVDTDGASDVSFRIDIAVVVPLCVDKLIAKTRTMIDVSVGEESNISVVESEEGYLGYIPFTAKNPMGKSLYYQANCQVNGIGMTSVSISLRTK